MMQRLIVTLFLAGSLLFPLIVDATELSYNDVPLDAWFRTAVETFVAEGYLDASQPAFRPGDAATRAEFTKLIVELNGGILDEIPAEPSFTDVSPGSWFYGYIEEAAREEWIQGDAACYGKPACTARPGAPVSRAEAAVLLRRAFGLKRTGKAPAFADNPGGSWFADAIQTAADFCILRGDDGTRFVRPDDVVNRAEAVTMLSRIDVAGTYPQCR